MIFITGDTHGDYNDFCSRMDKARPAPGDTVIVAGDFGFVWWTKSQKESLEKLKHSDGMIKGIIDLMFEEKDGIVIVDYKSDRGITLNQLKERYSMQLKLYKAAVELTTGTKVKEALLYSFELKKYIMIDI